MTIAKILATSVVRGSQQGESHGGIYLVDMNIGEVTEKFDWNNGEIDFDGRGADRGLRGIAFYQQQIIIAASNEIYIFDQSFSILASIQNCYLKHCHEICIFQHVLYISSTGFDSILRYDLRKKEFVSSLYLGISAQGYRLMAFDPLSSLGPKPCNKLHLNSVTCNAQGVHFSGRKSTHLFSLIKGKFIARAVLPLGSHNAQPFNDGIIYNDTEHDALCFIKQQRKYTSPVPTYPTQDIFNIDKYLSHVARPSFGRGLTLLNDGKVAAGSSPSTIAIHDIENNEIVSQINISMDVRNAIHGLAVWPFG